MLISFPPLLCGVWDMPDPYMGAQYQTSTHFQFGDHKESSASVYSKGTYSVT